jgi:hypothetical protein
MCTIVVPDSPAASGVQGTCSGSPSPNVTLALNPVESCPPEVCNSTACEGSNCTPVPGRFQMTLALHGIPAQVALNVSRDGNPAMSETIEPTSTTTEPNGAGCGTCTPGSTAASLAAD